MVSKKLEPILTDLGFVRDNWRGGIHGWRLDLDRGTVLNLYW